MTRRSIWRVAIGVAMVVLAPNASGAQRTTDLALGIESIARRDLAAANAHFARAAESPVASMRAAAEQWGGHLAWAVYSDSASASRHLARALASAPDSSTILIERARLDGFERRFRAGQRIAGAAMTRAPDAERRGLAARTLVSLMVDAAFAAAPRHIDDSLDASIIGAARDTLSDRVGRFPGRTPDAQALMSAAIVLHDPVALEKGWSSYFMLIDDEASGAVDSASAILHRGVSSASGSAWSAGCKDIASALAAGRQYELSALAILTSGSPPTPQAGLADVVPYARFLRGVRAASENYYRRALLHETREGDLLRAVNAQSHALWSELHWPSKPSPYYPAAVPGELRRRFATVMSIERGLPIPEIHLAHVLGSFMVNDASRGLRAHQVVLDGVAANGLDAWLLDGAGGRAGWAASDSIFEVRTAFTDAPFRAWTAVADPQSVPGETFRIHRDSIADIERASHDSLGYFPSIAAKMFHAGTTQIFDSLYALGKSQAETQRAFVGILFRQLTLTSITLHEGRHVADARAGRLRTPAGAEFRAKIDEVTGSTRPALALTAILSPTIGDASSHGQANRRIMIGVNRWIRANGAGIVGYDPAMPALLQLPHLTNAQLIAAFRSLQSR